MQVTSTVADLKAHLEQGAELLGSHVPGLADLAAKLEADPFVQAAITTSLSPDGRALVTDLMQRLEALEAAQAAAQPPPDPGPDLAQEVVTDPGPDLAEPPA